MFNLDYKQTVLLDRWREEQNKQVARLQGKDEPYYGAIGGAYTYCFTPTQLGVVVVVRNELTKEEINLTDYDSW